MKIAPNSTLLMTGDSITDAGRARPVGVGPGEALGTGYVSLVDALLGASCPERGVRVLNTGISGNTVRDLQTRWQTNVMDLKPDWVSVMIGVNDTWRQFDRPNEPESHVYHEEYAATLDALVAETMPRVKGIVLLTPFLVEPDATDAHRAMVDRYAASVREIAQKHGVLLGDTQAAFDVLLKHLPPAALAPDRVHPTLLGHMALARTLLQAVGFVW